NWRQSDLAREAGLGRDSISQYVNGKSLPDSGNAQKLADAFGIDVQKVYPPRFMRASNQSQTPSIQLTQASDDPGKAWLYINKALSYATAAEIIALLKDEGDVE